MLTSPEKNCTSFQLQYFKPFLTNLRLKTTLAYHLRTISKKLITFTDRDYN